MRNIGIALAGLTLLVAATTTPSMADDNGYRNYNQPVDQSDAQQTSASWNMEQYNSFTDTHTTSRYHSNPSTYNDMTPMTIQDQSTITTTTIMPGSQNNMVAIQDVASLQPFTRPCNYMSQPGFVRYLVFDQRGVWVPREQAIAIVESHPATGE